MPLADRLLEVAPLALQIADRRFPGRDALRRTLGLFLQITFIVPPELGDGRFRHQTLAQP